MTKQKTSENFIDTAISIIENAYHDMKEAGLDAPSDSESYEENLSTLRAWGEDMKSKGAEYCDRYALNILATAGEYWSKTIGQSYFLYKTRKASEELSRSEREEAEKLCQDLIMINSFCIANISNTYTELKNDSMELILEDIAKHSSKLASKERIDKVFSLMLVNDAILFTEWENKLFIALYSFALTDEDNEENENKINDIFIAYLEELGYKTKDKKKKYFSFQECFGNDESFSEPSTHSEQLLLSDYEESGAELIPAEPVKKNSPFKRDFPKTVTPNSNFVYLDKLNSKVWNISKTKVNGERIKHNFVDDSGAPILYSTNLAKNQKGEVPIYFSLDLPQEMELSKYDELVYFSLAHLYYNPTAEERDEGDYKKRYLEGKRRRVEVSYTDIYKAMGKDGKLGSNDRKRIKDSIAKMSGKLITIDNKGEVEAGYKYGEFNFTMPIISAVIKPSSVVLDAVELPFPLYVFAFQRNQFTTVPRELIAEAPKSQTEENLSIQNYLLKRIAQIKHKNSKGFYTSNSNRILYESLYEQCGATNERADRERRKRIRDTATVYLQFYTDKKHIAGFRVESDGVTIKRAPTKKAQK